MMDRKTEPTQSHEPEMDDKEVYEPPRLEAHGKLAEITGTRAGAGTDLSKGKRGLGDP